MKYDPLGDDMSSVEYVDHMGDDLRVVNAARVSFGQQSRYEYDETGKWLLDKDGQLIDFLAEHQHISPFFHPQICIRISMPLFLARLWWRSTVGVCRSEVYRRYVKSPPQFYTPPAWRLKAGEAKQASVEETVDAELSNAYSTQVERLYQQAQALYQEGLRLGIAPEMAHMVLPQSMYTQWIETGSLHYFARVCHLHADPTAQRELRPYVEAVGKIALGLFPVSWKALQTHGKNRCNGPPSPDPMD